MRFGLILSLMLSHTPRLGVAQAVSDVSFDAVVARLSQIETLRGEFEQIREIAVLQAPLASHGRYMISSLGLYWEQTEPFLSVTIAGENGISQRFADQPAVTMSPSEQPVAAAVSSVFTGIFRGDRAQLAEHFAIGFESHDDVWSMQLMPREFPLTEVIGEIVVVGSRFIDTLRMQDLDGGFLTIRFLNQSADPPELTASERDLYSR